MTRTMKNKGKIMNPTLRKYLSLIVLGFSGGAIYCLPYIKYVFYDAMLDVMHISNAQSGFLLSMYAFVCIFLYIPGGILADKVSSKKAIILSLLGTAAVTVIFMLTFSYPVALGVWFLFAFGSGFVFWSAILKAVRMIGTEQEQGFMYGVYYAANGAGGAITNAIALKVFDGFDNARDGMFWALLVMIAAMVVAAVLLQMLLRESSREEIAETPDSEKFHFADLGTVFRNPTIWLISLVFFCVYGVYSCASFFTPYLTDVIGFDTTTAGYLQIVRSYVVMLVAAPLGGFIADRLCKSTLKWFAIGGTVLGLSILAVILVGPDASGWLVAVLTLIPGLFAMCLYGVMFSSMHEIDIPVKVGGTAIGIASIVGYLPDVILQPFFGGLIDAKGNGGYTEIFWFLTAFCVVTVVISYGLYRNFARRHAPANAKSAEATA
ncbi:MFS transporter [Bifidobacterium breve]|nr:MFS transporter [Bifidobacterium breve]